MSKTDKTRPWWVRATERPLHTCVPVHNHANGVCDLPEDPRESRLGLRWGSGSCFWTEGPGFWYGPGGGCGCSMCTGQAGRRRERRANRHTAKTVAREAVATHRAGGGQAIEDFDDHVPSAATGWW